MFFMTDFFLLSDVEIWYFDCAECWC